MSGQPHAPAALLPGKEPPVPIGCQTGWALELVCMWWWRGNTVISPGIEPLFSLVVQPVGYAGPCRTENRGKPDKAEVRQDELNEGGVRGWRPEQRQYP
jgi:hypothetical protein